MSYKYHCFNHLDESAEHKKCEFCDSKGDVEVDKKQNIICQFNGECHVSNGFLKLIGESSGAVLGMNREQRHEALKKRSKKHYKTDIKEREMQMQKDMIRASTK